MLIASTQSTIALAMNRFIPLILRLLSAIGISMALALLFAWSTQDNAMSPLAVQRLHADA